ncbi:MAG TPA: LuxR C-terminal-related transcriptional regulator [Marmoricola sp.]|nr:LuxR C-terminal-related transcriptional regulator [Marmoricola sp.]
MGRPHRRGLLPSRLVRAPRRPHRHARPQPARAPLTRSRRRDALARLEALTGREREVLVEVGLGHSNTEIAARLHMSEATVKSHISHLFDKLAVTNRAQVAIAAHRAGLVD